jgi:hypothetical protein
MKNNLSLREEDAPLSAMGEREVHGLVVAHTTR